MTKSIEIYLSDETQRRVIGAGQGRVTSIKDRMVKG